MTAPSRAKAIKAVEAIFDRYVSILLLLVGLLVLYLQVIEV